MTPQEWKTEIERRDEIISSYKTLIPRAWNDAIDAAVASIKNELPFTRLKTAAKHLLELKHGSNP